MIAAALVLSASITAGAAPGPTKARQPKEYTIEQFFATTGVRDASFSSDEKRILFSSNQTGVYNVYSIPVTGGTPTPLTSSATDTTYAVSYFPRDDRILYTRDAGGNELNHLYVRDADGKERDLTPGEKLKATFDGWTGDRTGFWVETNERDPKYFDLYRYDAKSYDRTLVYKNDAGYSIGAISPDGKRLALVKTNGTADSDIYLWSSATNAAKNVTPHTGLADNSPQEFDPATGALYYLSNQGGEFARVRKLDAATGKSEDVEKPAWDVSFTGFSKNGRYRATAVNEDGHTAVHVEDRRNGREVVLPKLPAGDITTIHFAESERRMAFYLNGDRSPANLYVYEFGARSPVRLTDSLSREIDAADLVDSEVVRFQASDGMAIPSIFYRPQQATEQNRVPALVWVHGGTGRADAEGLQRHNPIPRQSRLRRPRHQQPRQLRLRQDLLRRRRSQARQGAAPRLRRGEEISRQPALGGPGPDRHHRRQLRRLHGARGARVPARRVRGRRRHLRRFQLAAHPREHPAWWESQRLALYQEIGDPEKDREMLREISPVFHADRIRRPLLVLQGANDPRVIKPESDDIVAAVKKNGVPVEYIVFADEGHGFTKKKNQIEGYRRDPALPRQVPEEIAGRREGKLPSLGLPQSLSHARRPGTPGFASRRRAIHRGSRFRQLALRLVSAPGVLRPSDGVEQTSAVGTGTHRFSTADEGVELGRDAHVAAAAVRPAHQGNHGRAPTRAAEIVVRGEEVSGDGFPKRRPVAFERAENAIRQRSGPRESTIDFGKLRQRTQGSLHRHRTALASGSTRRSSAETASKMASASGASRIVFTTFVSANICESL